MIYFPIGILLIFCLYFWYRRRFSVIDALLLTSSITVWFDWSVDFGPARPSRLDAMTIVCVLVWIGYLKKTSGVLKITKHGLLSFGYLAAFPLWCVLMWLVHPNNESAITMGWKASRIGFLLIYIILGIQLAGRPEKIKQMVVHRWIAGGVFNAVVGFVQTVTAGRYLYGFFTNGRYLGIFSPIPANQLANHSRAFLRTNSFSGLRVRGSGTAMDAIWFAPFLVIITGLCIGLALTAKDRKKAYIYFAAAGICIVGILISASRSSIVSVAVLIIYLLLTQLPRLIQKTVPLLTFTISGVVVAILIFGVMQANTSFLDQSLRLTIERALQFSLEDADGHSVDARFALWSHAYDKISETPQTVLTGTGDLLDKDEVDGWEGRGDGGAIPLHNQYVEVLYFCGLLSLIIFLMLNLYIFLVSVRSSKQKSIFGRVAFGFQLSLVGLAVNGLGINWMTYGSTFTASIFLFVSSFMVAEYVRQRLLARSRQYHHPRTAKKIKPALT